MGKRNPAAMGEILGTTLLVAHYVQAAISKKHRGKKHSTHNQIIYLLICDAGGQTQGLAHATLLPYH